VKGTAPSLRTNEEIEKAERAQVWSWTASEKSHYVRVIPQLVIGRRFQFGAPGIEILIHALPNLPRSRRGRGMNSSDSNTTSAAGIQ